MEQKVVAFLMLNWRVIIWLDIVKAYSLPNTQIKGGQQPLYSIRISIRSIISKYIRSSLYLSDLSSLCSIHVDVYIQKIKNY